MKLVYSWIEQHLGIINQGINFGSTWIYSHEYDPINYKITFHRKPDPNSLPDLFALGESKLQNVTAIIGENGTGKTNILSYLGDAISGEHNFADPLIYEDDQGDTILVVNSTPVSISRFMEREGAPTRTLQIEASFEHKVVKNDDSIAAVYYSPIYDFRRSTSEEHNWVNVSSNYLLRRDSEDKRKDVEENFRSWDYHKVSEVRRQLKFILTLTDSDIKKDIETLYIPDFVAIDFVSFSVPIQLDSSGAYNFPPEVRGFLAEQFKGDGLWLGEVHVITDQERKINNGQNPKKLSGGKFKKLQNIIRWKAYVFALKNIFAALIQNADIDPGNSLLNRDFHTAIDNVNRQSYDIKLDFSSLPSTSVSNFERWLTDFLQNQDTFYIDSIFELFGEIKKTIFQNDVEDWSVYHEKCRILVPPRDVSPLLDAYSKLLSRHTYLANVPVTWGFIDFEWDGLSSGEAAYLSLFTRLSVAKDAILQHNETNSHKSPKGPAKKHVIVLIDEGEQGFHLQWQRNYVFMLVKSLPKLFGLDLKVQIIFATHSPISLSDIPKSHIVLLRSEGLPKTVKILDASQLSVNTFAGNIYDLLKDSFFLSEGFVGKFAVTKINSLIRYLRKDVDDENDTIMESIDTHLFDRSEDENDFTKEGARALITTIDDPLLRQKLWDLFFRKYRDFSEEQRLQDQIDRIQASLNSLRSRK